MVFLLNMAGECYTTMKMFQDEALIFVSTHYREYFAIPSTGDVHHSQYSSISEVQIIDPVNQGQIIGNFYRMHEVMKTKQ